MMPQLVADPPDVLLSMVEQIEPLLWLGFVGNLYCMSHLRLHLTRHCQVCGYTGSDAEDLRLHLHAVHPVHLQECQYLIEMFNWCMFMEWGCFCNPSPGWGELHHECVGLIQLALIVATFGWQVVLPWTYTSQEVVGLLCNMLPCQALQRVTMNMLTRNFHRLWEDTELLQMLKTYCLVCQEPVTLSHIQAHLVVAHQITEDRLKYVTHQLSALFAQLSLAEERCDWCNELLHTYLDADDALQVDVHAHLQKCPMITQFAMLLMHPRWSAPALQPLTWASQERICENRRKHELKMWQFNVSNSDTYGQSLEPTAQCGILLLEDQLLAECVKYQCLLCSKVFFSNLKLCEHLHKQHNFSQLQTHMCYQRLAQRCTSPCSFCGLKQHSQQCPVLLNLSVFLLNGYGLRGLGRHRLGIQDLGQPSDEGSNGQAGNLFSGQGGQQRQQTSSNRSQTGSQRTLSFYLHHDGVHGSAGDAMPSSVATRGHAQQSPTGESVPVASGPRPREHSPPDDGDQPHLAPAGRQTGPIETPSCSVHDAGDGATAEEADGGHAYGGAVPGLQVLSFGEGRPQQDNALSALEPPTQMPGAHGADLPPHHRGAPQPAEHLASDGRPSGDTSFPQSEKDGRQQGDHAGSPMGMDGGTTPRSGAVARSCQIGLSQFLAAHPGPSTSTGPRENTAGQTDSEGDLILLPIFLNSTGTACFANAVILCLCWQTLLSNGFEPSCWKHGYAMLRTIFCANHLPLDLTKMDPFRWLLLGTWTVESFRSQQDACEFAVYILHVMQPQLLHCGWVTRPALLAPGDEALQLEKGTRFTPVALSYTDHTADACTLQALVEFWHDHQGFCRAAEKAGQQLILSLDRFNPDSGTKCDQKIDLLTLGIDFPCFSNSAGDITMEHFEICAITYHLGLTPHSGHYRAVVRYRNMWMNYEDGRPPDKHHTLPDQILRNSCMFWMVRKTPENARTMETEDPSVFRSFSTLTRAGDAEVAQEDSTI